TIKHDVDCLPSIYLLEEIHVRGDHFTQRFVRAIEFNEPFGWHRRRNSEGWSTPDSFYVQDGSRAIGIGRFERVFNGTMLFAGGGRWRSVKFKAQERHNRIVPARFEFLLAQRLQRFINVRLVRNGIIVRVTAHFGLLARRLCYFLDDESFLNISATYVAAAICTPGSSPKPTSQCTPRSRRNQVIWRFAYCRVAC